MPYTVEEALRRRLDEIENGVQVEPPKTRKKKLKQLQLIRFLIRDRERLPSENRFDRDMYLVEIGAHLQQFFPVGITAVDGLLDRVLRDLNPAINEKLPPGRVQRRGKELGIEGLARNTVKKKLAARAKSRMVKTSRILTK